jgi:replicative superfamily II helicase
MVAELIAMKEIMESAHRALYIVPYVSIVTEKAQYLKNIYKNINVKVDGLHSLSNRLI